MGGVLVHPALNNLFRRMGVSGGTAGVLMILFGVLVLIFPNLVAILVGAYLVIVGLLTFASHTGALRGGS